MFSPTPLRRSLATAAALALSAAYDPQVALAQNAAPWAQHGPLKVSDNHRFLVYGDGSPFFYLGDTAWELFHRLNREEAEQYLSDRAKKGFTVIQAVALAELDGLNDPNAYGFRPLIDLDPTRPDIKEGPDNDYWDQVDFVVNRAERLGLVVAMLPTWGDKWNKKWGVGPEIFNAENARTYGQWLGARYKEKPIIWVLGGDRPVENPAQREIIRAMAEGLRAGDGGRHLITLHPSGGSGSAQYFHQEPWLDFNMRQNGHTAEFNPRYEETRKDYDRSPTKPVIDAEPLYEDHPISFKAAEHGHSVAADVRRTLYWDLFTGACGYTYGNHAIWQMFDPAKRKPINNPLMSWNEALAQPGGSQMQYGRRLLESRPVLTRIPDDSIIVENRVKTSVPGAGTRRYVATRDEAGTYAMIYAPIGRTFSVRLGAIKGAEIRAWWYDPRTGEARLIGNFANTGKDAEFQPPTPGELTDWVLVLDDAAKGYPPPGSVK